MSQPVMALPAAGLGDADRSYGEMVGLAANNAAAFETEAAQVSATLRGPGTTPRLSGDVAFALRNMREGLFPILQSVMGGLANTDAQDALKLAEASVRARLVVQARTAVEARNRATPGMGWTRYLGGTGTALRNMVGVWNEAGAGRVVWGEGTYENRRIQQEVNTQIAARFAGKTFDQLSDTPQQNDKKLVLEEVGRLAPNTMAFNMQGLLEWAKTEKSNVDDPKHAGEKLNYYDLLETLMRKEQVASRYTVASLGLIRSNPELRLRLEELYKDVFVTNITKAKEKLDPLQKAYEKQLRMERDSKDVKKYLEVARQGTDFIEKIFAEEESLISLEKQIAEASRSSGGGSGGDRTKAEIMKLRSNVTQVRKTMRQFLGELLARKGTLVKGMKLYYKYLKQESEESPALGIPTGELSRVETLVNDLSTKFTALTLNVEGGQTPPKGTLKGHGAFVALAEDLQEIMDGKPEKKLNGLAHRQEAFQDDIDRREEPYSEDYHPEFFGKYKDFAELKHKYAEAVAGLNEAQHQVPSNEKTKLYTPHQLLYELNYRQLVVEIPPPVPGTSPAAANARNLAIEDAMTRATISTLMLIDRVDSSMDEGFAVRHAQNITRTRLTRWSERKARLNFGEFVKNNLTRNERFKGLKDLKVDTNANTILQWINEERLKEEDLTPLLREVELAGQDELGGKGKLEFTIDLRPLLYQIQLAHYRRRAETLVAKAKEPGAGKKAEAMLELIKTEAPKMIPPSPAPGDSPSSVETRPESRKRQVLAELGDKLKLVGEDTEEGKVIAREMGMIERLGTEFGAELFAEIVANALIKIPGWLKRRGARGATEEVGEKAADALSAVRKRTKKAAQAVTHTAAKLAA